MNDTAQNTQNNVQTTSSQPVQQQSQVQTPPVTQQPIPQPVGQAQKETGPVASEYIKPTEQAPRIHPELQELGMEESPSHEVPKLTLEDKKAGLGLAKESTPVSTSPSGSITLPLTGQQAKQALRKKISDSMRWLALLILRQLKKQSFRKS